LRRFAELLLRVWDIKDFKDFRDFRDLKDLTPSLALTLRERGLGSTT